MIIACTYDVLSQSIFPHFGQTSFFFVYDSDSKQAIVMDSQGKSHADLVLVLEDANVNVLLCGGIGSHAIELLNQVHIEVVPGVTGLVEQAIVDYLVGKLKPDMSMVHECSHHH